MKSDKSTPLMDQYTSIKKKYSDAVLFFRMGDFYEMFYDDAKIASEVLGLTLTSRAHGKSADVPLAGFPHHSVEPYLTKMLKAGYRVAICEQVEDPKKAKGIVKREVLEVITPGTATSENVIDSSSNNYLISIYKEGARLGIAGIDLSTGEFFLSEEDEHLILSQIESLNPPEILYPVELGDVIKPLIRWTPQPLFTPVDDYYFSPDYAADTLLSHFKTVSLKGFGCEQYTLGISAAGAALKYLQGIQDGRLGHIQKLSVMNPSSYMIIDRTTRRNLELLSPIMEENRSGSLLAVIDGTVTRMGARLLKSWLLHPLLDVEKIRLRLQAVEELFEEHERRDDLTAVLKKTNDIERITAKLNARRANGRDLRGLCDSLKLVPLLKKSLEGAHAHVLRSYHDSLDPVKDTVGEIDRALVEDPPVGINDGRLICGGYDQELDRFRSIAGSGKEWIADLQEKEKAATGISSLKIKYNKVFGYYIEVTNPHRDKVPQHYIRKQTLVNAERFITPDMKQREEEILHAEERIVELEKSLFLELCGRVIEKTAVLQKNAGIIANIDVLCGLAFVARENGYCKPEVNDSSTVILVESRHPVVERLLPPGEPFIPNDHSMNPEEDLVHIITGPNMAGKSTFLRQVGLCVLMAQIGSFVPAGKAEIGIVDRIFTRVGAMDDVSRGESTFLVEMLELANILNNATPRSILLLDEIGRGTSTFDGLSIAWATVEYIHNTPGVAAKTLFATHYHELTALGHMIPRVKNYRVQVKEWGDSVIFLRKIVPGSADHSYGIQVARMAGIPPGLIDRAKEILASLEAMELTPHRYLKESVFGTEHDTGTQGIQISLFSYEDSVMREKLNSVDPDTITPLQALQLLFELKKLILGSNNETTSQS
ncbi:DNA mismatch repair protein MutS [candidate division KSB1 bacterium]